MKEVMLFLSFLSIGLIFTDCLFRNQDGSPGQGRVKVRQDFEDIPNQDRVHLKAKLNLEVILNQGHGRTNFRQGVADIQGRVQGRMKVKRESVDVLGRGHVKVAQEVIGIRGQGRAMLAKWI